MRQVGAARVPAPGCAAGGGAPAVCSEPSLGLRSLPQLARRQQAAGPASGCGTAWQPPHAAPHTPPTFFIPLHFISLHHLAGQPRDGGLRPGAGDRRQRHHQLGRHRGPQLGHRGWAATGTSALAGRALVGRLVSAGCLRLRPARNRTLCGSRASARQPAAQPDLAALLCCPAGMPVIEVWRSKQVGRSLAWSMQAAVAAQCKRGTLPSQSAARAHLPSPNPLHVPPLLTFPHHRPCLGRRSSS